MSQASTPQENNSALAVEQVGSHLQVRIECRDWRVSEGEEIDPADAQLHELRLTAHTDTGQVYLALGRKEQPGDPACASPVSLEASLEVHEGRPFLRVGRANSLMELHITLDDDGLLLLTPDNDSYQWCPVAPSRLTYHSTSARKLRADANDEAHIMKDALSLKNLSRAYGALAESARAVDNAPESMRPILLVMQGDAEARMEAEIGRILDRECVDASRIRSLIEYQRGAEGPGVGG